jgi:hypothetical protein
MRRSGAGGSTENEESPMERRSLTMASKQGDKPKEQRKCGGGGGEQLLLLGIGPRNG